MRLGYVNVDKMLKEITGRQLLEWMWYNDLEPFDEERGDIRAAQIVTMLANVNRDPKKRPKPYELKDFILKFEESKKRTQTWRDQKQIAQALVEAFNATAST